MVAGYRHTSRSNTLEASSIQRIVYPGYGLTTAEIAELKPVLTTFSEDTDLVSFEEAMP